MCQHDEPRAWIRSWRFVPSRIRATVFTRGLDLPRGREREIVRNRDRDGGQTFYASAKRERELEHDVQSIAPTNVKRRAFRSAAHASRESSSTTNSSATTSVGSMSTIAIATTSARWHLSERRLSAILRRCRLSRKSQTRLDRGPVKAVSPPCGAKRSVAP